MPPEELQVAQEHQAEEILHLQRLAFQREAELCQDFTIAPLTQPLEELRQQIRTLCFLVLLHADQVVGSARAEEKDGTCYIYRVIVHPEHQGRGLGKQLMRGMEARFPHVRRFELFTGAHSQRNLHFYHSLGYRETGGSLESHGVRLVVLEKPNATGPRDI